MGCVFPCVQRIYFNQLNMPELPEVETIREDQG